MSATVVLLISLFALIAINVPIAISLGLSSAIALLVEGFSITSIPSIIQATIEKFSLLTIPLFVLAGNAMDEGGISKRLINLAKIGLGNLTGGLGYIMVVVALFFAAISGSGTATVAAVGAILIPSMTKEGYDPRFSAALSAISGSLGTIIPPSISFVVYGMITGVSIGSLFMCGIVPGCIIAALLCIVVYFYSKKNGWRSQKTEYSKKELRKALMDSFWGILSPIIVLGGIYGGIFTPTESAAVAAVYSIIVGMFVYREMTWKGFINTLMRTAKSTGLIMLIVACAGVFSYALQYLGIATGITNWALSLTSSKTVMLIVFMVIFLIAGCLMDGVSSMYVLLPIIVPIAQAMDINLVYLGIITVVNLSIGQVTPPVGPNLYVAADLAGVKFTSVLRYAFVFIGVALFGLLLLMFVPGICTIFA